MTIVVIKKTRINEYEPDFFSNFITFTPITVCFDKERKKMINTTV